MRLLLVSGYCRSFSAATEYFLCFPLAYPSTLTRNNNLHLVIKICLASITDCHLLHSCGTCITPPQEKLSWNMWGESLSRPTELGLENEIPPSTFTACTHFKTGGAAARVFCFNIRWTEKESKPPESCVSGPQELRGEFKGHPEQAWGSTWPFSRRI